MLKIIGTIIGALVLIVSIYYLVKEKQDKESKQIYTIASIVGLAIILIALFLL